MGHEFEQTPEDSAGQGSLACCSPWGHKESAMTELLNNSPTDVPPKAPEEDCTLKGPLLLDFSSTNILEIFFGQITSGTHMPPVIPPSEPKTH